MTIISDAYRTIAIVLVLAISFVVLEPVLGAAQFNDQFTVTQTVTAELSFLTTAADVTMSPSIAGITGGTANGATQVVVNTNNTAGYNLTIVSSSTDMEGDTQGGSIGAYTITGSTTPEFTFSVGANTAEFAYTVEASTTADLDQDFLDNTTICGTGSTDTADACWHPASTTAKTIVNRTTETVASGATTTIKWRVQITSDPAPAVPEDTYVSTSTLTATAN